MTIYETIKAAISVKQAAEHYGLKVSHNGMACCPFHNDRHPSLKLNTVRKSRYLIPRYLILSVRWKLPQKAKVFLLTTKAARLPQPMSS